MKNNKVTLSLRRRMQRAMNGKLYSETRAGVEDNTMVKLHGMFPSLFDNVAKEMGLYDIQISIKRVA